MVSYAYYTYKYSYDCFLYIYFKVCTYKVLTSLVKTFIFSTLLLWLPLIQRIPIKLIKVSKGLVHTKKKNGEFDTFSLEIPANGMFLVFCFWLFILLLFIRKTSLTFYINNILTVLCVRIISNVILLENYKYWFLSFGFYINWKKIKWRLSTYIWLKLKFSIIKEIARIALIFFVLLLVIWFTGSHRARCIQGDIWFLHITI